jgi:hypothetical protein
VAAEAEEAGEVVVGEAVSADSDFASPNRSKGSAGMPRTSQGRLRMSDGFLRFLISAGGAKCGQEDNSLAPF